MRIFFVGFTLRMREVDFYACALKTSNRHYKADALHGGSAFCEARS